MSSTRRIADIQVLRGIAVLAVVAHHFLTGNLLPWSPLLLTHIQHGFGGDAGVDLFLVISGYVIARQLLPQLDQGEGFPVMRQFWYRRMQRLWPAAWSWLLLSLAGTYLYNRSGAWGSVHAAWMSALAALFQVADIRFAHCFGRYECGAATVYWSLSLEEQFYLILPWALLWVRPRWRLPVLFALILAQLFAHLLYVWAPYRSLGLICGVTLAVIDRIWPLRERAATWSRKALLGVFLLLQLPFWAMLAPHWGVHGPLSYNLEALLGTGIVLCAIVLQDGLLNLPGGRWLAWVGDRSYSLYLCHFSVFWVVRESIFRYLPQVTPTSPYAVAYLLAFPLMLLVAHISWVVFERWPLRRWRHEENPVWQFSAAE